jgi:hypothetical protein
MLLMPPRAQTRAKEQTAPGLSHARTMQTDVQEVGTVETPEGVWEPIPGTSLFSRNGAGAYVHMGGHQFLRVDNPDVDAGAHAAAVAKRFRVALESPKETEAAGIDASAEQEATEILARMDRELVVEEALTKQLLQRYGLAS